MNSEEEWDNKPLAFGKKSKRRGKPNKRKQGLHQGQRTGDSQISCPICMKQVHQTDAATLPACRHSYCVYCIVRWAEEKDCALCPVCKHGFETVLISRNLDGTARDSEYEESVCLVKRTSWYLRHTKWQTQPIRASGYQNVEEEGDWDDAYFYANDIDDTEDYYFSNAAGSARIVLSNRKFGKNGFIRSGRVYAQSTQSVDSTKQKEKSHDSAPLQPERQKTNTKGKKALRREKKKMEQANRLA